MGAAVRLTRQQPGPAWAVLTTVVVARAYRAMILTWAVIALLPTLFGASSHVIRSGSMEPSISVGDVVVAREVAAEDRIAVGRVYVFEDPARSADRLMVHRVVAREDGGDYTTAGDANEVTDVEPLPRGEIRARAVLLVPWIGLPVTWAAEGAWLSLTVWMLLTALAFVVASHRLRDDARSGAPGPGASGRPETRGRPGRGRGLVPAAMAVLISLPVLQQAQSSVAEAAFTARTSSAGSTWGVGQLRQPYVDAVLADSPLLLWLLDEDGGAWAQDRSGSGHTGRYSGVAGYRLDGGLPNNHGYAVRPGATGRIVDDAPRSVAPSTFTIELWFSTTTRSGGRLAGFESTRDPASALSDRTVHMGDDGRLVYGAWAAPSQKTLVTPSAYNDGRWHHLVVVATARGANQDTTLYVDGREVAWGATSKAETYSGWWRVGAGTRPTGPTAPSAAGFDGLVDNVAIYPFALSAARVAEHYRVR
ncbi:signal peptidase I [Janibacter terrae]|uniref:signal peptidase I n=1 Tax=Janibacter terrae TaxID=103817 RepID=UPI0038020C6F